MYNNLGTGSLRSSKPRCSASRRTCKSSRALQMTVLVLVESLGPSRDLLLLLLLLLLLYLMSSLYRLNPFMPQGKRRICYTVDTDTPRPSYGQKTPKKLKGFNVSFLTERWSRMVSCQCSGRSLYFNAEEEPKYQEGEPQQACSVYRHTETDIFPICLRRPGLAVC